MDFYKTGIDFALKMHGFSRMYSDCLEQSKTLHYEESLKEVAM
jgi:hypothetical protein